MASGGYIVTAAATGAIGLAATVWQVGLAAGRCLVRARDSLACPRRDARIARATGGLWPRLRARACGRQSRRRRRAAPWPPAWSPGSASVTRCTSLRFRGDLRGGRDYRPPLPEARRRRGSGHPTTEGSARAWRSARGGLCSGRCCRLRPSSSGNIATKPAHPGALPTLLHHGGRSVTAATTLAVPDLRWTQSVRLVLPSPSAGVTGSTGQARGLSSRAAPRSTSPPTLLFALPSHSSGLVLVAAFLLAGTGIGFAETAESALVVSGSCRTGYAVAASGCSEGCNRLATLRSSAIVGVLWAAVSPTVAFAYAAGWMVVSLLVVLARSRAPGHRMTLPV